MITTTVIDNDLIGTHLKYFLDLNSENQNWAHAPTEEDEQCLDDVLDKIEVQTIVSKDNNLAAYIRTQPVQTEQEDRLLKKIAAKVKRTASNVLGKTVDDVFDVKFDMPARVYETRTKQGTVYDIFINADAHKKILNCDNKLMLSRALLHPNKTKQKIQDKRRVRRNMAKFLQTLTQLYQKLGISDGHLVLQTEYDRRAPIDGVQTRFQVAETGQHESTVFYDKKGKEAIVGNDSPPEFRPKKKRKKQTPKHIDYKNPKHIKKLLDQYVIGQESAKITLAEAVCDHHAITKNDALSDAKANISLIGPSGSGKTYLAKTIAKEILNVPYYESALAGMTQEGFVGRSVSSILENLIEEAGSIEKAQHAVVFLDELDKIAATDGDRGVGSDKVQNELLRMLNGDNVETKYGVIDTSKILFICAGAFEELREQQGNAGFTNQPTKTSYTRIDEDVLIDYGLKRELVGRLPHIAILDELSQQQLKQALTSKKRSLVTTYQALFKEYDIDLEFTDGALSYIAQRAYEKGTGARALKSIIADTLKGLRSPNQYQNGNNLIITRDIVEKQLNT